MKTRFRIITDAHVPVIDEVASVLERHGLDCTPVSARSQAGIAVLTIASAQADASEAQAIIDELAEVEAVRCAELVFLP